MPEYAFRKVQEPTKFGYQCRSMIGSANRKEKGGSAEIRRNDLAAISPLWQQIHTITYLSQRRSRRRKQK